MRTRVRKAVLLTSLFTGLFCAIGAEASTDPTHPLKLIPHPGGKVEGRQPVAPGESASITARAGRRPATSRIDGDDLGVIVRLTGEPLLRLKGMAAGALRTTQAQRLAALDRLAGEIVERDSAARRTRGLAVKSKTEVVRRRYTHVFNGLAARVRRDGVEELRALPGVTGVWIDQQASASLAESVPLIRADQVWSQLGYRGQGVTVAILDTGIDYTHPDLGGCFPGCKVLFGWDFVNDDADPMDDSGHGTHVAGIVAANGVVKGVAPDASLMAIKVLDQYGYGTFSEVLAGMELAADPDGNPATNDGAQVMNLSLGGPGDPDDPLSQAVDTAVAAGVVVAVAAGNSGPDFETIESPGCARQALTVGASDKIDVIADFSSRGFAPTTYQIKPELLAPGVGIRSTVPTGTCELCDPSGYLSLDGTSMATPHVAGAAALLLSGHGGWTPQQVKAALMQRAVNLGLDAYVQGSGRVDAFAAATHKALIDLPAFSAGRDNPGLATFAASRTFTLTNLTALPTDYSLALAGTFPAGLTVSLDQSSVHLGGNQAGSFILSLACNNALLPNVAGEPFAYEGTVVATGPSEVLRFPFALVKAPLLTVNYDQGPWTVIVHDKGAFFKYFVYPGTTLSTLAPAPVDVVNLYSDTVTWVLREGLSISTDTQISIHKTDAIHTVAFHPTTQSGTPLVPTRSMTVSYLAPKAQNYSSYVLGDYGGNLGSPTTFHLSPMSPAYTFEASLLQEPSGPGATYVFLGSAANGISGPIAFDNSPADFRHVTWRYTPDPGGTNVTPHTWLSTRPYATFAFFGFAECDTPQGLAAPYEREAYLIPAPYPDFSVGYLMQDVFGQAPINPCEFSNHLYTTPYLMATSTSRIEAHHRFVDTPVVSSSDPVLVSGVGPYSWTGRFANVPDQIRVEGGPYYAFMSQGKDVRDYPPLEYELSQGGATVATGAFDGSESFNPLALPVAPGRFRLRVPYTWFHLAGQPARADVAAVFDTQSADPNPPFLGTLHLSSGGAWVDRVPAGGAQASLTALDDVGVGEVMLYSKTGGSGYQPLTVMQQPSGEYSAAIPGTGAPALVSLAAVLKDASGNSLTYSFCTAATASAEVCDGFDDDCDGAIPATEADNDGDLVPQCAPDCNDASPQIWSTPGEVPGVSLEGGGGPTTLTWSPPAGGSPAAMTYDVLRSASASDFVLTAVCLESGSGPGVTALDAETPVPGQVLYYLVRGRDACPAGVGTIGYDSDSVERSGRTCP